MKKILLLLLIVSNFVFAQDSDSFKSTVLDNSKKIEELASKTKNTEARETIITDENITNDLENFKSIVISSAMNVELILAENSKIEITGKDVDKLTIANSNKELKLTTSLGKKFKTDLVVKIYYTKGLRYLKLANQVKLTAKDIIEEKFLDIEAINNVKVDLSLKTDNFIANLTLGSNIVLKGVTETQKINVASKSFYDAFNFKSKKAFVEAKASQVAVNVSDFLDASAKYKAEIVYMGDPFSVNEKTFLGKVIKKENK